MVVAGPVEQHVGDVLRLALDEAEQQLQQLVAAPCREPPHHAEVDEGEAVARQVEHVARVRVGVEEAVLDDHLEHRLRAALREQRPVVAGLGRQPIQLVTRNAVDPVLHVDALAGVLPVHARDHDMRQRREVGRDALGAAAFGSEVELAAQRARELAHELARAVGLQRRQFGLGDRGDAVEQPQVGLDHVADAGAADLDDDFAAVLQLRAVHLRDRRAGQRLGVEAREHGLGFGAEILAQLRAQRVQRHGGHAAVQLLELGDPVGAEQVGAAGEDLAELDEGGAEFLERHAHLRRRLEPREVGGVIVVDSVAGAFERIGQPEPAHAVAEAVPHQHADDLVQAPEIARRAQGLDQHGREYAARPAGVSARAARAAARRGSGRRRRP